MVASNTTLPAVDPFACNRELTFGEFNLRIGQLLERDRVLEQAVTNFTNAAELTRISELLDAVELLLGEDLVQSVIDDGLLPADVKDFSTFQTDTEQRITEIEAANIITEADGTSRSLKSLALNNQQNIVALTARIDQLETDLEAVSEITDDIDFIKTTLESQESRLADLEVIVADVAQEVKNARREFADDPAKRLIDKIDNLDGRIESNLSNIKALIKEVTDARAPDRFDTLAERIGALESSIEEVFEALNTLQGRGTVTGIRVGRSILHGDVELIPGSNLAITRERNGYRVDIVDIGTCVDLAAPIVDPNNGCCPPGNANFGN